MNSIFLTTAIILFPLWAPLWNDHPFTSQDLDETMLPSFTAEMLREADVYLQDSDLTMKENFLRILVSHQVPQARALVLKQLSREKDIRLIAMILRMLPPGDDLSPALLEPYLQSESPIVVESAIRLYATLPNAKPDKLLPFLSSSLEANPISPAVRLAAWQSFASRQDFAEYLGARVCMFQGDALPEVRMLALLVALKQKTVAPLLAEWVQKVADGDDSLAKLALATIPRREFKPQTATLSASPETALRLRLTENLNGDFLDLLPALCHDQSPAVRTAAMATIGRLVSPENANGLANLLFPALEDTTNQVRTSAHDALAIAMQKCPELHDQALAILTSRDQPPSELTRLGLYELVRAPEAIIALMATETHPENLVAAINSLRLSAEPGTCGEVLIPLTKHVAPTVREAAAKAIGYLRVPGAEKSLIALASLNEPLPVRIAAYEAMGRNPSLAYSKCLLTCLEKTGKTVFEERAAAAWSCGHLLAQNNDELEDHIIPLAQQMFIQCTRPVVPMMGMMSFDDNTVIANCLYALGNLKRNYHHDEIISLANRVIATYNNPPEGAQEQAAPGQEQPPCSDLTYSLAHQLFQELNGEQPERRRHASYNVSLPCQRYQE
ncbi:MAG: hypothetical protein J6866_01510 [Victivallales bacterium]|nr:hypothetical protein [Victivallales bacterium]